MYDIHQDSTGTLWVATYGGGLNRFRDGRFKAITTQDGLPDNLLLGLLEDGEGNLWFSSNQSVFRLSLKELNDFADGKISFLSPVSYGAAEGMRSTESNGGSPGGWITRDGRIWFPTLRGVVAIDPTAGNRFPPPVVLEEAWANKLPLAGKGRTSVPPGNNTFDFRFTALSFSAPEKLHFKYRLEPFDKDWVDARTHHTAHYTNMDPGEYSFHVLAANNFGIWSDQEASVRFAAAAALLPDELVSRPLRGEYADTAVVRLPVACPATGASVQHASGRARKRTHTHCARPARHALAEFSGTLATFSGRHLHVSGTSG